MCEMRRVANANCFTRGNMNVPREVVVVVCVSACMVMCGCSPRFDDVPCAKNENCLGERPYCLRGVCSLAPEAAQLGDPDGGVCVPNPTPTACVGNTPRYCGPDGSWRSGTPCAAGSTCLSGVCACATQRASCVGSTLVICKGDGTAATPVECPAGCDGTTARCRKVVPSNGLGTDFYEATFDWIAAPGVAISTGDAVTQPTMTGGGTPLIAMVPQASGPEIAVFKFHSISIPEGVAVRITGSRPVALVASTTASIAGTIDVSSSYDIDGGAGANLGACAPGHSPTDTGGSPSKRWGCGASGGSYGTVAGTGGTANNQTCMIASVDNSACTNVALVPLIGGGAGGSSWSDNPEGPSLLGGSGGGAVQIVAGASISVSGTITASGGGGGFRRWSYWGKMYDQLPGNYGGVGGGSGGAILLEAPVVLLSGGLFVNGGGGSGGVLASALALPPAGQNGGVFTGGEAAAAGSDSNSGLGGVGASGSTVAGSGTRAMLDGASGGGGGGGGAGRIRVNDFSSTLTCQATSSFFPKLVGVTTCGNLVTQ